MFQTHPSPPHQLQEPYRGMEGKRERVVSLEGPSLAMIVHLKVETACTFYKPINILCLQKTHRTTKGGPTNALNLPCHASQHIDEESRQLVGVGTQIFLWQREETCPLGADHGTILRLMNHQCCNHLGDEVAQETKSTWVGSTMTMSAKV